MKHLGMTEDELKPYNIPKAKPAEIPKQVNNVLINCLIILVMII